MMDCPEIPPCMPQVAVRSLVEEDGEMLPDEDIASYKTNYPEYVYYVFNNRLFYAIFFMNFVYNRLNLKYSI